MVLPKKNNKCLHVANKNGILFCCGCFSKPSTSKECHPPAGSSFIDLPKGEGLKPWSGVAGLPKGTGPTAVL